MFGVRTIAIAPWLGLGFGLELVLELLLELVLGANFLGSNCPRTVMFLDFSSTNFFFFVKFQCFTCKETARVLI